VIILAQLLTDVTQGKPEWALIWITVGETYGIKSTFCNAEGVEFEFLK
jgi:hypothetical protein